VQLQQHGGAHPDLPVSDGASADPAGLYRRPLPPELVDFRAPAGRTLLLEALQAGTAEAFHALVAQLHTQGKPAWCGLGSLVTVLNALEIDPGRTWQGPWRWFGEELLDCCVSLEQSAAAGLTLDEVAVIAGCNGAAVQRHRAEEGGLPAFRAALEESCRAPAGPFLVAAYDRAALGQTGQGHYSPLAAWHAASDRALILDVARFKYPPHWVPLPRLWSAMRALDPTTARPRGWLRLERALRAAPDPGPAAALAERLTALGAEGVPCCPPEAGPEPAG
jgi:glutathione gamma-glutamylcysteinyltransferase